MIDGRKVLAVIPARGGSKGLPRKNVLPLGGRPLIAWSIDSARRSQLIDHSIVSTDDEEIAAVSRQCGGEVPFMRPTELASDTATTPDVIRHVIEMLPEYDIVIILQPTNPFRSIADIDNALRMMVEQQANSVVSVTEPDKSPYWSFLVTSDHKLSPILGDENSRKRRQDLPRAVTLNGVIYAIDSKHFLKTGLLVDGDTLAYEMPKERSLDIDTEQDLKIAEFLAQQHDRQHKLSEVLP